MAKFGQKIGIYIYKAPFCPSVTFPQFFNADVKMTSSVLLISILIKCCYLRASSHVSTSKSRTIDRISIPLGILIDEDKPFS